jgi:hypothetical protein
MASVTSKVDNTPDGVYLNVNVSNGAAAPVPLNFTQSLTNSIVDDPGSYFLSCIRWTLTGTSIPQWIWQPNTLYVGLSLGAFTQTSPLLYPFASAPPPPVPAGAVYSYQTLADMISRAWAKAFTDMALQPGFPGYPVGAVAPYMLYDPASHVYSIYVGASFLDSGSTPATIGIYMNTQLYLFFNNFYIDVPTFVSISHLDVRIRCFDYHGSNSAPLDPSIPVGLYKIAQDYAAPGRTQQACKRVSFLTNTLGVRYEYQINVGANSSADSQTSGFGIPSANLLTDFVPAGDPADPAGYRSELLYLPSAQYRLTDLQGGSSRSIDISVFYYDAANTAYPFLLDTNATATFKLLFVKRSLYKNPSELTIKK